MKQFKDAAGQIWSIAVNVNTASRVRDRTAVNLFDLFTGDQATTLFSDPAKLVGVLYVLLESQIEKRGFTEEQFAEVMLGDALEEAADALLDAVIDFFPQRRRQVLTLTVEKSRAVGAKMTQRTLETLNAIDPETFVPIGGSKPIASAAPSVSTPVP